MISKLLSFFGPDPLRQEVKNRYGLVYEDHPHPMISGSGCPKAWLGRHGNIEVSLRFFSYWELIAGELFPIIDLTLAPVVPGKRPKLFTLEEGVAKITHTSGRLAEQFFIDQVGHLEEPFLGPQLAEPKINRALLSLSTAVRSVAFYKRGVQLALVRKKMTMDSFDADLRAASEIARALQQLHSIEMVRTAHKPK